MTQQQAPDVPLLASMRFHMTTGDVVEADVDPHGLVRNLSGQDARWVITDYGTIICVAQIAFIEPVH